MVETGTKRIDELQEKLDRLPIDWDTDNDALVRENQRLKAIIDKQLY